jgi:hypothetical protein
MIASAALGFGVSAAAASAADASKVKSVVLVHGGFVDGAGWELAAASAVECRARGTRIVHRLYAAAAARY